MLATTEVRELLRVAIIERDHAAEEEANAARAVVRAKQLVDEAEQTLAALAGVDEEVNAHHANAIKAWAASGGERPAGDLPSHLASKKAFKVDIEAKVATARRAHEQLKAELAAAVERLQNRNADVRRAAGAVLSAEAEPIIKQLMDARQSVWSLEDQLSSLSDVLNAGRIAEAKQGGATFTGTLPRISFAALSEKDRPMLAVNEPHPYGVARSKWEAYLQALQQDPTNSMFD